MLGSRLDYRGRAISGLLAQIPLDVTLADDEAEHLMAQGGPAWKLWQLLHDIKPRPQDRNRLGPVAAGKLLRKRPHLIPVYDSHVKEVLQRPSNDQTWWHDLRCQLVRDDNLVRGFKGCVPGRVQPPVPAADLRCHVLDVQAEGEEAADTRPPGTGVGCVVTAAATSARIADCGVEAEFRVSLQSAASQSGCSPGTRQSR